MTDQGETYQGGTSLCLLTPTTLTCTLCAVKVCVCVCVKVTCVQEMQGVRRGRGRRGELLAGADGAPGPEGAVSWGRELHRQHLSHVHRGWGGGAEPSDHGGV